MAKRARQEENTHEKELVKINAGGKIYYTTQKTLTANFPNSMIATLFSRKTMIDKDNDGVYFLDVDPTLFGALLNVMRRPSLVDVVPQGITQETWWYELDYWGIREYTEIKEDAAELLPLTLSTKIGLLREKRIAMEKQVKGCNLLLLEKILEWTDFDGVILSRGFSLSSEVFIPPEFLYLDPVTGQFGAKAGMSPACVCVAGYIWTLRARFVQMLKDVVKYTSVTIESRSRQEPFLFEGKSHRPVSGKPPLYIRIEQCYIS